MSGIHSATSCAQRILQEDLNLDHYLICQKGDGTVYLREKPFFEKYFGLKCFSDRTDADFPKMVRSAAALLNRLRNDSEINTHSKQAATAEKIYRLVEKVLKAGHFESPDEATRDLLKKIDNHYRNITGYAGKLSTYYPELPDPVQDPVLSNPTLPVESRSPLQNANSNGFVNTTLHVLAHVSAYSNLLDPQKNPLKQGSQETGAAFQARKDAQKCLNSVTQGILNGTSCYPTAVLCEINHALEMMGQPQWNLLQPKGQTCHFLFDIMQICGASYDTSDHTHYANTEILSVPGQLEAGLKTWQKNDQQKHPDVLVVFNFRDHENQFDTEIQMGGHIYRLEAIEEEDEATNRTVPWLRKENGDFVKLEDRTESAVVVKEEEGRFHLKKAGWLQAHYVRLELKLT